ncbi:hypothetical protein BJ742DRAFT_769406 [Cladochytrium replicatum]|nr:hypothetical protein BJ742DRAFT_769406 [Cladochytrium replicatum]
MSTQALGWSFREDNADPVLTDESLEFTSKWTGIQDRNALRNHVITVWKEVRSSLHVYKCIQSMMFLYPRGTLNPKFKPVLDRISSNISVAEIGCCFGTDIRSMIVHGAKPENLTAIDLTNGYWNFGKKLFQDDLRETGASLAKVRTIFDDMAVTISSEYSDSVLEKYSLVSNQDAVIATAVLHVLDRTQCENVVKRVFGMLKPGGFFVGSCVGAQTAGVWERPGATNQRWRHSRDSLNDLFEAVGFVDVIVDDEGLRGEIKGVDDAVYLSFTARRPDSPPN